MITIKVKRDWICEWVRVYVRQKKIKREKEKSAQKGQEKERGHQTRVPVRICVCVYYFLLSVPVRLDRPLKPSAYFIVRRSTWHMRCHTDPC